MNLAIDCFLPYLVSDQGEAEAIRLGLAAGLSVDVEKVAWAMQLFEEREELRYAAEVATYSGRVDDMHRLRQAQAESLEEIMKNRWSFKRVLGLQKLTNTYLDQSKKFQAQGDIVKATHFLGEALDAYDELDLTNLPLAFNLIEQARKLHREDFAYDFCEKEKLWKKGAMIAKKQRDYMVRAVYETLNSLDELYAKRQDVRELRRLA